MSTINNQLTQCMKDIELRDQALSNAILACRTLLCESYYLPSIKKEEEALMINSQPTMVEVVRQSKRGVAIANLLDIYANDGESTRFSSRHPGVIVLTGYQAEFNALSKAADGATTAREAFILACQEIKNKKERFDVVHEIFPYLNVNNLRRKLNVFHNVSAIVFSWANKPVITKPTKDQVEARIRRQIEMDSNPLTEQQGNAEIAELNSVSRPKDMRYIRPTRVQPIIRLDKHCENCPSPVIVFNDDGQLPSLKPLGDYDSSNRKKRGMQVAYEEVIPRLHLYVKAAS